jgi:aminoglycoside phosphotransferase (APT) family kinase protein
VRDKWKRGTAEIKLDPDAVTRLVTAGLPAARVTGHRRLLGGKSNTNLAVDLAGPPARVVLRLYQRDPAQARKEAALAPVLRERRVSAPRMLHFADTNPVTGHPCALFEWVEGDRLEAVMRDLGPAGLVALAPALGAALAAIHAIPFPHTGFLADDLRVPEAVEMGRTGLLAYLRRCLHDGPGGKRLGDKLTRDLIAFVEREGHCLEGWLRSPCLTHADFNGSNILVRRAASSVWTVTAVLDWEFAFSGSPAFDFGNLLRPPLGESPGFATALVEGYRKAGGTVPENWRRIAAIADLYSWADFLARPESGHAVIADARRIVAATIAMR